MTSQTVYPPRRYLAAEDRKREILEVAAPLFFERGYEGTEMAEIASRAGVSRALLHRHFGGKQEILLDIIRAVADVPPKTLHDPGIPLDERIERNADVWLDHFEENPNLLAVTQLPLGGNNEIAAAVDEIREGIIDRILDNYLDGEPAPEELASMMRGYVAMILTVAYEWVGKQRINRQQARIVMVSVLHSLLRETAPALRAASSI
jgi:AcrR family transcriptional regulator